MFLKFLFIFIFPPSLTPFNLTSCSFTCLKQTKQSVCKSKTKPWSLIYTGNYLGMGPVLQYVWYTQCHSIEKTGFPSPSSYQSQTATWLGVGLCGHFPSSMLGFYLTCASADLMSDVTVSVRLYVHQLCWVWRTMLSWSQPPPPETQIDAASMSHHLWPSGLLVMQVL